MSCEMFRRNVGVKALLVVSIAFSCALTAFSQDEQLKYEKKQKAAWRERFEEELRRSGVQPSEEEKAAAFKEYMARVKERADKQKGLIEGGNKQLILSGQVLDQDGQPVPNAEVTAAVQEEHTVGINFYRLQTIERVVVAQTDAAGNFTLDGGRGRWISIQNISAPGYEFILEQQTAKDFYTDESVALLKPQGKRIDNNKRVVLKAWKQKGKPDKLVVEEAHFRIAKDGKKHLYNVFRPRGKKMLREVQEGESLDGDLLFSVLDSKPKGRVLLRIEAVNGGVSDQNNSGFIAPKDGYSPTYDIDVTEGDQQATVFVRSRDGMIYTRLTVNVWYNTENYTAIGIKYASNPQGRTNLQPKGGEYRPHMLEALNQERTKQKSSSQENKSK